MAGLDNIYATPSASSINDWCDYLELLCWVNENRELSVGDAEDAISDDGIGQDGLEGVLDSTSLIDEILGDQDDLVAFGEESQDDPEDNIGSEKPRLEDLFSTRLLDVFINMSYRNDHFEEMYPFDVDLDAMKIKLRSQSLQRKFYLMMNVSASLKYALKYMPSLTGIFEIVGKKLIQNILPSNNSVVEIYGKNVSQTPTPFNGTEFNKLQALGSSLNVALKPNANLNYISKYSTGDNGLDIVGYVDFGDGAPGNEIIFAQCACGRDWIDKQFEVSCVRWDNYLDFVNNPTPYIIIPRVFRDADNEWENPLKLYGTVPIDRYRILTSLNEEQMTELFEHYETHYEEINSNTFDAFD